MNTRCYMVIIKGEIKTSEIMSCGYNRNNSANDRLLFAHIHNRRGKRLHARVPTPCTGTVFHGRQKQNF